MADVMTEQVLDLLSSGPKHLGEVFDGVLGTERNYVAIEHLRRRLIHLQEQGLIWNDPLAGPEGQDVVGLVGSAR